MEYLYYSIIWFTGNSTKGIIYMCSVGLRNERGLNSQMVKIPIYRIVCVLV